MKGHSTSEDSATALQAVMFLNGSWWYLDLRSERRVRLDPLFVKCHWKIGILCKSLGIGQRTFSRILGKSLGTTGKKWLRQLRYFEACRLLRDECKIRDIASEMGFRDDSCFAREFREHAGMSPSDYRRLNRPQDLHGVAAKN